MSWHSFRCVAGGALLAITSAGVIHAAVPSSVSFQGILKDGSGSPVADGPYFVTFRVYSVATGGSALWADTQTVTTSGGIFQAVLGSNLPITPSLFADTPRFLGVTVFPDAEMVPRQRIQASAYAFHVATVDGATGGVISGDVDLQGNLDVDGTLDAAGPSSRMRFEYGTLGDLPDPSLYHGMFAHVHSLGRAYYAHGGAWVPLARSVHGHYDLMAADSSPVQALYVDTAGLVGIGTTSPKASLDVNGDLIRTTYRVSGTSSAYPLDTGLVPFRQLGFPKRRADTGIRVTYTDLPSIHGTGGLRLEILFNGAPCPSPGPLIFDYYDSSNIGETDYSQTVCGTCFGLPEGNRIITIRAEAVPGAPVNTISMNLFNGRWTLEAEEVR